MIKIKKNYLKMVPIFILFVLIFKFIYNNNGFSSFMKICIPIFTGVFFAIVLNPLLNFTQTKLKIKSRGIAIALTYLIFLVIILLLITMIVPGITSSIADFLSDFPDLLKQFSEYIIDFANNSFIDGNTDINKWFEQTVLTVSQKLYNFASSMLNTAIISAISIISTTWNILLSLFISIYILYDKEYFENLFYRTCHSLFEKKNADEIVHLGYNFYSNVTNFIAGKLIDSLIIGAIAYIVSAYLIKAHYPLLISVMLGITNMIPYFGPFIGGIPAVIITLLFDPIKGFWMIIFIIILQQFDGWFLGPKILGIKLELKPVWIIISIIIGGGLFGPIGMFLATPIAALVKTILEGYITLKLKDKEITLPHQKK
ncbi:AI-2E family transporter [Sedimentibacter sp. zth1]|uniref:AI-2E family transporter n=1 Tax=Sedimentibacter sp. zth1 TaxID=2816908 RepID=UPI001A91B7DD|nr:AI-2E family transporter [Sedimentibacter sp. zth1]QSX05137.1 AI-2E family transporter [Sedimentibacter sp. zth1]